VSGPDVLAAARALLGTPWRHLGRSAAGIDCIGLVLLAGRGAGITLPDPAPYAREPSSQALREGLAAHLNQVALDALLPGDVLAFNVGLYAAHVGIYGTHPAYRVPSVVHAYLPRRVVVEEVLQPIAPQLTGAYRWREG
jgi:cell wall-associated NlpC family hydrolase